MAHRNLEDILSHLKQTLPDASSLTSDDLNDLQYAIEVVLGNDRPSIYQYRDASFSKLRYDLSQLYDAIDYFQTLWAFQAAVAWDGLLSVLYNFTGLEILHVREVMRSFDPELSAMFERVCELAAPLIPSDPETNWVGSNRRGDPYKAIGEAANEEIEALENQFNDNLEALWLRVIAKLEAAQHVVKH